MPLEGLCTRQLWTLPYRQKNRNATVSLFLVYVTLNSQHKHKNLSWRGLSALSF